MDQGRKLSLDPMQTIPFTLRQFGRLSLRGFQRTRVSEEVSGPARGFHLDIGGGEQSRKAVCAATHAPTLQTRMDSNDRLPGQWGQTRVGGRVQPP